ncbi:DUF6183 family protein [Streptomyces mirabilis]|uniref:DUF6183 family protein n=1 Tax=Streptomyces mirabilis TaxID=68239 RepID=UPI00368E7515
MPRFVASLLAEHQQVTDLAATVFDGREWERLDELRACLFQELVLRDVDIDTFPALRSCPLVRPGRPPWPGCRCTAATSRPMPTSRAARSAAPPAGCRVGCPRRVA